MPTAPIDDQGTVLYYEDSGAPDDSAEYLTIVLIHGVVFHGAIFHPLLPFAASYRLRLIFVNMRDYPGSSNFPEEDLEALAHTDPDVQAAAVKIMGRDIAFCLEYLIKTHEIPAVSEVQGKRIGGVVLLGWSLGNLPTLAMLGNALELPEETKRFLGRFMRTVVMYDPTVTLVGADPPLGVYYPLRDLDLSLDERRDLFPRWIASYFTPVQDLETVTEEILAKRKPLHDDEATPAVMPTVARMSSAEYQSVTKPAVFHGSYAKIRLLTKQTYSDNLRKSLFDTGGVWANVDVLHIWCNMSVSEGVWAAKYVLDEVRAKSNHPTARKVGVVKLAGGNHFAHWDEPASFVKLLAESL